MVFIPRFAALNTPTRHDYHSAGQVGHRDEALAHDVADGTAGDHERALGRRLADDIAGRDQRMADMAAPHPGRATEFTRAASEDPCPHRDASAGSRLDHPASERITGNERVGRRILFAREAVRHMSTANGGRGGCIVNISSKAAVLGGSGEWVHYAASKGALESMTTGLAKEVAAVGIRVNAVRPGLIETDFNEHASPGRVERVRPMVPMQRSGTVEEVAAAVLWLCSDASSYTTGAFVDVSGGR